MEMIAREQIYSRYIALWPDKIGVGDGAESRNGGYVLSELCRVHSEIEDQIDHATDHWGNIFTWSMFQACHEYGKSLAERGETVMEIRAVPLELIDKYVVFNLSGPDWPTERAQYWALGSNHSLQARRP